MGSGQIKPPSGFMLDNIEPPPGFIIDAAESNLPPFDITVPEGTDPTEMAKQIVVGGLPEIPKAKLPSEAELPTGFKIDLAPASGEGNIAADYAHTTRAVAETVIGLAQGMAGFIGGAGTGLLELAQSPDLTKITAKDVARAKVAAEKAAERLSILEPQTEEAKQALAWVSQKLEPVFKTFRQIGEGPGKVLGSPAIEYIGGVLAEVIGPAKLHTAIKDVRLAREFGKELKRSVPKVDPEVTSPPKGFVLDEVKPVESMKLEKPVEAPIETAPKPTEILTEKPVVETLPEVKVETGIKEIIEPESNMERVVPEVDGAKPADSGTTGIRNEITAGERAARGLSEVEVLQRRSNTVAFDEGKRRIDSGEVDPRLLAQELADKPRAITPEETAILTIDRQRIKTDHKSAMDAVEKAKEKGDTIAEAEARVKLADVEEIYNTNDAAARLVGYESGASLQARKMMIDEDYSLTAMLQKHRVETGKPVTPEIRAKFESFSKQIEDLNNKLKLRDDQISQAEASKAVTKIRFEVEKEQRQTKRTYAKQELSVEFSELTKELNSLLGGQLNAGLDPTAVAVLAKMAKNRVKSGIITVEGLVDSIYTEVKKMGVDLSERDIRDAISGYGITSQMSKEAVNVQLRELKRQMRLISALEDAKESKVPLRSGLQRDQPTEVVRILEKQVKQVMRENGVDSASTQSPEVQWKTALDGIKTRLKNSIVDVTREIETGERIPKKKGIEYDAEAKSLKEKRDFLVKVRNAIEEPTAEFLLEKPGEIPVKKTRVVSQEKQVEAAIKAAERTAGEYARRVNEGDLSPKKKGSTVIKTPELIEARQRAAEWKKFVNQLKEEANPKRTPEEIALKAFKTRAANRIKELEERLSKGDFTETPKRTTALDAEALKLKFERDKVIKKYNEAVFMESVKNRTPLQKIGAGVAEAMNLSRAIKTSFDLSALLRQGGLLNFGDPRLIANEIREMSKAIKSEKGQFTVEQEIMNRPNYPLYKEGKLFLAEHGVKLSDMEEAYMSRYAEKIPGVGASQRAYNATLNVLRADKFDYLLEKLSEKGTPTPVELKAIGTFVNEFTGRGSVKGSENALVGMNTIFFAPRYVLSRFQVLVGHPMWGGTARTRMLIAQEYAKTLTGIGVVLGMGLAAGGSVETDPRSSDLGKIKIGKTRVDPFAGLSQTSVLLGKEILGASKSPQGKINPIREGLVYGVRNPKISYGGDNAASVIGRFLRSKLSPVVGTAVSQLAGEDVVGNKVTPSDLPEQLLMPISFNDIYETMKEQGVPAGTALGTLSIFGMGLQTFTTKKKGVW